MPTIKKSYLDNRTKSKLIWTATNVLLDYLADDKQSKKERAKIAKDLVSRQIPNLTEEQGQVAGKTIIQFIRDQSKPVFQQVSIEKGASDKVLEDKQL